MINPMKRVKNLYEKLVSYANIRIAIQEVNKTHRWRKSHKPNPCTAWVEETIEERIKELREIIENGFVPKEPRVSKRWDASARKYRIIKEPAQYPDQYIHHALIQILQPVMMKGMDYYCCGSIRDRGTAHARKAIQKWMKNDIKGTKYCLCADIKHFYDSINPEIVTDRMKQLIKDHRVLDLIERINKNGISIGAYTSQWFANTALQPLDRIIRKSEGCRHYVRYMDNLTVFGSNKRKLRYLREDIKKWLNEHGLELKGDWQIFPCKKRLPQAVGFRYGRGYTLIRKYNLFRIKRAVNEYRRAKAKGKDVTFEFAAGLLSRLGQLIHCNNKDIYKRLFNGERIINELKKSVRGYAFEFRLTWEDYKNRRNQRDVESMSGMLKVRINLAARWRGDANGLDRNT